MSAWKKLNHQDVFVTTYPARKSWHASGSLTGSYGLETLRGFSGSVTDRHYPHDLYKGRHEELNFRSVDQLYYRGTSGSLGYSGSIYEKSGSAYDLHYQSTLTLSRSRDLNTEVGIISIPRKVYGTHIVPHSLLFTPESASKDKYLTDGYITDQFDGTNQYTEDIGYWYDSGPLNNTPYISSSATYVTESNGLYVDINRSQQSIQIIDDGEGRLVTAYSHLDYTKPLRVVGDIIYNEGMLIITDTDVARYLSTFSRHNLRWKSNQPIYTYNVHCKVKDSELNHTYNSSALTGSFGLKADNVSGSNFTPYITTVGMYNDANELIAVAKTNHPIQKTQNTDMTFVVKIDI